jgi:Na+-transporting methylmalonyl-CoA/oxaloacetate decarboxylase gamma subunit
VENPLVTALVITAIGMSLLFLSLVLFYGIISLLTAVTRERSSMPPAGAAIAEGRGDAPERRALQAAAIAIALARAEVEQGPGTLDGAPVSASSDGGMTRWWSLHHQHRLAQQRIRRRPL